MIKLKWDMEEQMEGVIPQHRLLCLSSSSVGTLGPQDTAAHPSAAAILTRRGDHFFLGHIIAYKMGYRNILILLAFAIIWDLKFLFLWKEAFLWIRSFLSKRFSGP